MRIKSLTSLVLFLSCGLTFAAPPTLNIPDEVKAVQGYVRVTPKSDAVGITYIALDGVYPFPSEELKDNKKFILPVTGLKEGRYRFTAVAASATGEFTIKEFVALVGNTPTPPPKPVDPDVKPVDPPKPDVPVTSFRVIYIVESGQTLTSAQYNTIYAKSTRDYLTAKTNRDGTGWRIWDKDQKVSNEATILQSMWSAVLPKVTTTPCVAIEVNGKVEIVPLPSSPEDNVALLKKYYGDK